MIKRTHFWRRLHSGNNKYIIMVTNKSEEDDIAIPPESYNQTFEQLGIVDKAQIVLYNMANIYSQDADEEGEEEGEEEIEELEENAEEGAPEVQV
jgi:hypothetical protein